MYHIELWHVFALAAVETIAIIAGITLLAMLGSRILAELGLIAGRIEQTSKGRHRSNGVGNGNRNGHESRRQPRSGQKMGKEGDIPVWPTSVRRQTRNDGVPVGRGLYVAGGQRLAG